MFVYHVSISLIPAKLIFNNTSTWIPAPPNETSLNHINYLCDGNIDFEYEKVNLWVQVILLHEPLGEWNNDRLAREGSLLHMRMHVAIT